MANGNARTTGIGLMAMNAIKSLLYSIDKFADALLLQLLRCTGSVLIDAEKAVVAQALLIN